MRQQVTSESKSEGTSEERVPLVTLNTLRLYFLPIFWLGSEPHWFLFTELHMSFPGWTVNSLNPADAKLMCQLPNAPCSPPSALAPPSSQECNLEDQAPSDPSQAALGPGHLSLLASLPSAHSQQEHLFSLPGTLAKPCRHPTHHEQVWGYDFVS